MRWVRAGPAAARVPESSRQIRCSQQKCDGDPPSLVCVGQSHVHLDAGWATGASKEQQERDSLESDLTDARPYLSLAPATPGIENRIILDDPAIFKPEERHQVKTKVPWSRAAGTNEAHCRASPSMIIVIHVIANIRKGAKQCSIRSSYVGVDPRFTEVPGREHAGHKAPTVTNADRFVVAFKTNAGP